ncbi:MAG TPA: glycosyltransferase family 4 protein [Opitutaceae bacterium]|nr:glycosyltransferase family 4 protein [Opitutaceae bacterium]
MRLTIVTGFFLPVPPVRGGSTEKIWHRLAQEWAAAGEDVTLVSRQWPGFPDREVAGGVRHLRLPGSDHSASLVRNLWQDFRWGLRVGRALPPADVVICNTVTLPVWLRRFRPRAGRVVAVAARMPKGHGRAYGAVDLVLALGEPVARKLREENPSLAARIAPFPYPIDWELHARSAGPKAGPGQPVTLGYVGRLHPEKGLELLLGAASELARRPGLPEWRLRVIGPAGVAAGGGGERWWEALRGRHAGALGRRLEWSGPDFDAASLARSYGSMDLFCYPSVAEQGETFGVAVAEAMAARCAPVVSALACFRQLVSDGDTGLVFDHRAPDAEKRLAGQLAALVADAGRRRAIAERAQARAREFDFGPAARALLHKLAEFGSNPG